MIVVYQEELAFLNELPSEAALVLIPADQSNARAVGANLVNNPCCVLRGGSSLTWTFSLTRNEPSLRFYTGVVFGCFQRRPTYVGFIREMIELPKHAGLIVVDHQFIGTDDPEQATLRLLDLILAPIPVAA